MKTKSIIIYFATITAIALLMSAAFFYLFNKEKDTLQKNTISAYRESSSKLIVDRIYEDLLIGNEIESLRKLNLIKESKIINDFSIYRNLHIDTNDWDHCEKVYFDKVTKLTKWGEVCFKFAATLKTQNSLNLQGISVIFFSIIFSMVLLLLSVFKKVNSSNKELYSSIALVLSNNETEQQLKKSFWAPVLKELKALVLKANEAEIKLTTQKIEKEKINLALQVAHDIKSPLVILDNIDLSSFENTDNHSLVIGAIDRLKRISNALLEFGRTNHAEQVEIVDLRKILDDSIKSKKIEYPNRIIKYLDENQACLARINTTDFQSIISNLINNSVEASAEDSIINVRITSNNFLTIIISDTGIGMPPDLLQRVGKERISAGKIEGNGIGIFHAAQLIERWGGILYIQSELGEGTSITINLPKKDISPASLNILLDNDDLIRLTWISKARKKGIDLRAFSTSNELFNELSNISSEAFFYIDCELDNEKGEEVALELYNKGYKNITLCTGHPKSKFSELNYIKDVIGKSPPF